MDSDPSHLCNTGLDGMLCLIVQCSHFVFMSKVPAYRSQEGTSNPFAIPNTQLQQRPASTGNPNG
eukprot:506961-Amphidinium_carterae.1